MSENPIGPVTAVMSPIGLSVSPTWRLSSSRLAWWELAEELIDRSCDTIEERLEVSGRFAYPFAWRSLIDAHRGRFDRARTTLRPLVEESAGAEKAWWAAILLSVLGFVEYAAGDYQAADRALTQMRDLLDQIGIADGLLDRTEPFHIELLLELGEVDRARESTRAARAKRTDVSADLDRFDAAPCAGDRERGSGRPGRRSRRARRA